jgi:GH24 family phage-related lysozyme (muramidase)
MVLDSVGINFMKSNEGCPTNSRNECVAYQDERGIWTIGFGHTQGVYKGLVWTKTKAEAVFKSDVDLKYGKCVNTYIRKTMNQNQFNAMVDLCYNIGVSNNPHYPGFPLSQVCKKFNLGDIKGASNAFMGWIKPPSLIPRRQREIKLFNTVPSNQPKTDKNQVAVNNALKDKQAQAKNSQALQDKLTAQDRREQMAEDALIKKYQLENNKIKLAQAQAIAKANANKRAADIAKAKAKAIADAKAKEKVLNNALNPTPSKLPILKSGMSVIGVLAIVFLISSIDTKDIY